MKKWRLTAVSQFRDVRRTHVLRQWEKGLAWRGVAFCSHLEEEVKGTHGKEVDATQQETRRRWGATPQ